VRLLFTDHGAFGAGTTSTKATKNTKQNRLVFVSMVVVVPLVIAEGAVSVCGLAD